MTRVASWLLQVGFGRKNHSRNLVVSLSNVEPGQRNLHGWEAIAEVVDDLLRVEIGFLVRTMAQLETSNAQAEANKIQAEANKSDADFRKNQSEMMLLLLQQQQQQTNNNAQATRMEPMVTAIHRNVLTMMNGTNSSNS